MIRLITTGVVLLFAFWLFRRVTAIGRSTPAGGTEAMSRAQALAVLGLENDATRQEIVAAHRQLIQKLHPDRGGSDYLAAQINQAKAVLLD